MGAQFSVAIVIRAFDKATAHLRLLQRNLNGMVKPMRELSRETAKLRDATGLPKLTNAIGEASTGIGEFLDKLDHAILKMGAFGGGVALAAYEISRSFSEQGEEISRTSKQLGLSTEQLQIWRYAAADAGVGSSSFTQGIVGLAKVVSGARRGFMEPLQALYQLGPEALDATGRVKALGDLLPVIADRFKAIQNPTTRVGLAVRLFGKSGAEMLPLLTLGSAGIREMGEEARELGVIMGTDTLDAAQHSAAALRKIDAAIRGVKNTIGEVLSPGIVEASRAIRTWVEENRPLIEKFAKQFAEAIPGAMEATLAALRVVVGMLRVIGAVWNWFSALVGPTPAAIIAVSTALIYSLVPALAAAVGGLLVLSEALIATPAGWVILAIAGIAAALILLFAGIAALVRNWDSISGWFVSIWKKVSYAIATAVGAWKVVLGAAWDFIKTWAAKIGGWVVDKIVSAWSVLKDFFAELWAGIKDSFMSVFGWIVKVLLAPLELVNNLVKSVSDTPKIEVGASGGMAPAVSPQRLSAIAGSNRNQGTATVKVDFANMPKGTRVLPKSADGVDLDLSLGYSMALP